MPVRHITFLAQTADGYLYVGGQGLHRFNGHRFNAVPLQGLRSTIIDAMYHDRADRIWLRTAGNELAYFRNGRLRVLGDLRAPMREFTETADGSIWLGGFHGLAWIAPGADSIAYLTTADGLPSDSVGGVFDVGTERVAVTFVGIAAVFADSVASSGIRFGRLTPGQLGFTTPGYNVRADLNELWVRDDPNRPPLRYRAGKLARVHSETAVPLPGTDLRAPRAATLLSVSLGSAVPSARGDNSFPVGYSLDAGIQGADGQRWVSLRSERGRSNEIIRIRGEQAERILLQRHLRFSEVTAILGDREGSVWVGTDQGLLQLVPRHVFVLGAEQGLSTSLTTAVLQSRDGAVWVGTWGGGVYRFANGRLTAHLNRARGLPHDNVRSLYEARDGSLWVGMYKGYARLVGSRIVDRGNLSGEIRAIVEELDGTIWMAGNQTVATYRGGVVREDGKHPLAARQTWAMRRSADGTVWAGTDRGLYRIRDGVTAQIDSALGVTTGLIQMIQETADGSLWFGSYDQGLYRYRDGRFVSITTREGLHENGIWAMVEDGLGSVWLSSDRGICRTALTRLVAVADDEMSSQPTGKRIECAVFSEHDGLPSQEGNRASPAAWRMSDGRLLFNNQEGIVVIEPVGLRTMGEGVRTLVETVTADGDTLVSEDAGPFLIPPGTRQIGLDYAALSFLMPTQMRYRYRLDGYDDDWVDAQDRRRASYTNLSPGEYVFRVVSQGGTAEDETAEGRVVIRVQPTVVQSWWFRTLVVLGIMGLGFAAYRYRVNRLLEIERVRLRIAADLHDDIGANLSAIALMTEMLEHASPGAGPRSDHLSRIREAASETSASLRDTIWLVDPRHGDLRQLTRRMRDIAARQLPGVQVHFSGDLAGIDRQVGMAFMRQVLLLFKEMLHNVAKHAVARQVHVDVQVLGGQMVLTVVDDGVGFDEGSASPGYGLPNMRRRAQELGGGVQVSSATGRGTRVVLTLPIT